MDTETDSGYVMSEADLDICNRLYDAIIDYHVHVLNVAETLEPGAPPTIPMLAAAIAQGLLLPQAAMALVNDVIARLGERLEKGEAIV